jgi:dihydroflavonol-4-reductase
VSETPPMTPLILVTGGTGFVGSAVVTRLSREPECRVRVLVRATSDRGFLASLDPRPESVVGDVLDKASLLSAMRGSDLVVNCAGLNSFWERSRRPYCLLNIEAVRNVAEAAIESGLTKMVQVSTVMAYGFPADSPFSEESTPGTHVSQYARSKSRGDSVAQELCRRAGLPLVTVYLAAVVGAGDRKSVMQIHRFVRGAVPLMIDSPHRFTYVHIDDAAEAIVRATLAQDNAGERYLVGRDRLTTKEYFEIISAASGVPLPKRTIGRRTTLTLARLMSAAAKVTGRQPLMPYDLMATVYQDSLLFDGSKAERLLGLEYSPVESGLRDAVADVLRRGGE